MTAPWATARDAAAIRHREMVELRVGGTMEKYYQRECERDFEAGANFGRASLQDRISELEFRIKMMLDDGECELYRRQSAESIGYKASPYDRPSPPSAVEASLLAENAKLREERDNWKWEYENLWKFANDYEAQRDILKTALERVVSHSHAWVITEETGAVQMPIHDGYRRIASEAFASIRAAREGK